MRHLKRFALSLTALTVAVASFSGAAVASTYEAFCSRTVDPDQGHGASVLITDGSGNPIDWEAKGFAAAWNESSKRAGADGTIFFADSDTNWSVAGVKVSGNWTDVSYGAGCYPINNGSVSNLPRQAFRLIEPMLDPNMVGFVIPRAWDQMAGWELDLNGGQVTLTYPAGPDSALLAGAAGSRNGVGLPTGGPNGLYNHSDIPAGATVVLVDEFGNTYSPLASSANSATFDMPDDGVQFNFLVGGEGWTPSGLTYIPQEDLQQIRIVDGTGRSGMPYGFEGI